MPSVRARLMNLIEMAAELGAVTVPRHRAECVCGRQARRHGISTACEGAAYVVIKGVAGLHCSVCCLRRLMFLPLSRPRE